MKILQNFIHISYYGLKCFGPACSVRPLSTPLQNVENVVHTGCIYQPLRKRMAYNFAVLLAKKANFIADIHRTQHTNIVVH
mmetsp:Transcript_1773/g.5651  ORF Transcript_1773/g.5651 Transcript_1773/m.5651 type:complete len:81 (-) Transcript_1773:5351-5593(-)